MANQVIECSMNVLYKEAKCNELETNICCKSCKIKCDYRCRTSKLRMKCIYEIMDKE